MLVSLRKKNQILVKLRNVVTLFLKIIDKIFPNLSQIIDIKPVTIEQLKTATK